MTVAPVEVGPDDYVLASFPKSGNTWVRFMLANLMAGAGEIDFDHYHRYIPDMHVMQEPGTWCKWGDFPRLIKSHSLPAEAFARALYVVRDPRAALTSYWHFEGREGSLEEFMLRDDLWPSSWYEHVTRWIQHGQRRNLLFIRYEDLVHDPLRELHRILAYLNVSGVGERDIGRAIRVSSFERMKAIEKSKGFWRPLKGGSFVRSGKTQPWKEEGLSRAVLEEVVRRNREGMAYFGYL